MDKHTDQNEDKTKEKVILKRNDLVMGRRNSRANHGLLRKARD